MQIDVVSIFPEMFAALTDFGVSKRALQQKIWQCHLWNPRDFTHDAYRRIDDRPYGGGPGMVMMIAPLEKAVLAAKHRQKQAGIAAAPVIYLSPQGERFNDQKARQLAKQDALILLAGRYEGLDERFIQRHVDEEISLGDYVVSGGELPAMILMDAVIRLLPKVLNHQASAEQDSFAQGLLDYPHYTRPEVDQGDAVPDILLSGDHAAIELWRLKQALGRTALRRPDLLAKRLLTKQESRLLEAFLQEQDFDKKEKS